MKSWILVLISIGLVMAQTTVMVTLHDALCSIYLTLRDLLPPIFLIAIIAAAVIYAVGQILPAEMRAKATSWAANIVVYTVVAALVIVVVPWLVMQIVPELNLENVCSY